MIVPKHVAVPLVTTAVVGAAVAPTPLEVIVIAPGTFEATAILPVAVEESLKVPNVQLPVPLKEPPLTYTAAATPIACQRALITMVFCALVAMLVVVCPAFQLAVVHIGASTLIAETLSTDPPGAPVVVTNNSPLKEVPAKPVDVVDCTEEYNTVPPGSVCPAVAPHDADILKGTLAAGDHT